MNRKQFRSLLGEMSNLVEQANREESVLQESTVGESISNRVKALKDLNKPQTESVKKPARTLKQEETYSDEYKPMPKPEGVAAQMSKGPKSTGDDSSKPRVIPTASLSGQSKSLPQGLKTKVPNKAMDPLDVNKRSGKIAPEEPEADGAEYGLVDEPEEYTEAMDRLRTDWKRLMGESSWSVQPTVPKKKVQPPPVPLAAKKNLSPMTKGVLDHPSMSQKPQPVKNKFSGLVPGAEDMEEDSDMSSVGGMSTGTRPLPGKAKPKISIKSPRELGAHEFKQVPPPVPARAKSSQVKPAVDAFDKLRNQEIIRGLGSKHSAANVDDNSNANVMNRLRFKHSPGGGVD